MEIAKIYYPCDVEEDAFVKLVRFHLWPWLFLNMDEVFFFFNFFNLLLWN